MLKILPFLILSALGAPPEKSVSTGQGNADRAELEQFAKALRAEGEETARLLRAWAHDQRHPTGADVSGVWSFPAGASGMGFYVLEQKGTQITGAKYLPACGGIGSAIPIKGTYRDGVLVLIEHFKGGDTLTDRLRFRERDHQPVFEGMDAPFTGHVLMTARTEPPKLPAKVLAK